MGKKDKKKKKMSGSEKTALKTEKKLNAKEKKELAAAGEDDIEKVIAQIEREEAQRQKTVEVTVGQPSRRVNFSLTPHPFKDELIMLGGEFHDGKKTMVYGDMFFYNIGKKEWTVVKAPGAPPPRCGHQAVATATGKGELWVFGGEYSSPSESQFYHYKDLWLYRIGDKKWEKITAPGGPSSRSGHRMVHAKKKLIIFGGFYDNLRVNNYFNDIHMFDLGNYQWLKLDITGRVPAPRSGCIVLPTQQNSILVYGGYSKERITKDVEKGQVHMDMFVLNPTKNDETGLKWKWTMVKQTGANISPRCSTSGVLVQPGVAYMFGGVCDVEENEEELYGTFFNDLYALDLEKYEWRTVNLSGKKQIGGGTRRRRRRKEDAESNDDVSESDDEDSTTINPTQTVTDDDGIFTMTVGPTPVTSTNDEPSRSVVAVTACSPSPRRNAALAIKNGILYLYGGMFEDRDVLYTLNDFYSLDTRKLDEWKAISKDDLAGFEWLCSESSESEEEDEERESGSDSESDESNQNMDVD